jgi:hypothetical protein
MGGYTILWKLGTRGSLILNFSENPELGWLTTKLKNSPTLVCTICWVFTAEYWVLGQNFLQKWTHLFATKPCCGDSLNLSSLTQSLLSVFIMISHFVPFNLTWRIYGHWCICWRPTTLTGSLEPGMPSIISLPWAPHSYSNDDHTHVIVTKMYLSTWFFLSKWENLPPHIYLMSWNGLTRANYVGCMHGLAHSNGLTSTLPNVEAGAWPFHRQ